MRCQEIEEDLKSDFKLLNRNYWKGKYVSIPTVNHWTGDLTGKKGRQPGNVAVVRQLYSAILQHQLNHPIATKGLRKLQKQLSRHQPLPSQTANPSPDQIIYHSGQISSVEQSWAVFQLDRRLFGSSTRGVESRQTAILPLIIGRLFKAEDSLKLAA